MKCRKKDDKEEKNPRVKRVAITPTSADQIISFLFLHSYHTFIFSNILTYCIILFRKMVIPSVTLAPHLALIKNTLCYMQRFISFNINAPTYLFIF